jgi:hypothetical protein
MILYPDIPVPVLDLKEREKQDIPSMRVYLEYFLGWFHLLHADRTLQQLPHSSATASTPLYIITK